MDRRDFIGKTGILCAAGLFPLAGRSALVKPKYKLGLQLFSINKDMNKDPLGSLKAVKGMGYEDLETYGFDGEKGTFYGHKATEFKKILDDLQLSASSGHYAFNPFLPSRLMN